MKKIILLIIAIVLQSCYTLKPDSRSLSSKDYNERQQISNPVLVKKRNPIGVSFNIITPLIAGVAMYQYVDPVAKYQDDTETKGFKPANAAIGVIGMMAVNKIVDYAMGYNKEKNLNEISVEKWTKKTKLNALNNFISNDNYTELTIIPKSKESSFEVRNIDDIIEFKTFFENASEDNITQVVKKAILVLEQEDLVTLIDLYPNNNFSYDAKVKYIETAGNYDTFWERVRKYPEAKVDTELLASNLVINGNNAENFILKYPTSSYINKVKVNSFKNRYTASNLTNSELINNGFFNIEEIVFKQFFSNNYEITENYFNALYEIKKVNSLSEIAYFFTENNWLTKMVVSKNKLEKAWNIGYNQFSNGEDLVYLIKTFDTYDWNLSSYEINSFVENKFIEEIKRNVVVSYDFKQSKTDFDKWRNSNYSSAFIMGSDEVKFLVHGYITNNSKFTMPIEIQGKSDVKLKNEGAGEVLRKLTEIAAYGGASSGIKFIKEEKDVFNCGYLLPNEKMKYSLLYNIDGSLQSGIDIGLKGTIMSFQFAQRIIVDNHVVVPSLSKSILTTEMINKQNASLFFIDNDLPYSESIDPIRGQKQSIVREELAIEKERIIEENRLAAIEWEKNRPQRELLEKIKKEKQHEENINNEVKEIMAIKPENEISKSSVLNEEGCPCTKIEMPGWGVNQLYQRQDGKWFYEDNYLHENSIIFDTKEDAVRHFVNKYNPKDK